MELSLVEVLKGAWAALIPYLFWLHKKVDKVSEQSIRREEYNGTINSIRNEIREGNNQITQRLDVFISHMLEASNRK